MSDTSSRRPLPWWLPWTAMAVVVAAALLVGVSRDDGPQTAQDRVTALARQVKCPTCSGESAADSNSTTAKAIRVEMADAIAAGRTDRQILDSYLERFGDDALLIPTSSGLVGLVWILPVVFLALAGAGLVLAFVRWRRQPTMHATDADRDLVAAARVGEADGEASGSGGARPGGTAPGDAGAQS